MENTPQQDPRPDQTFVEQAEQPQVGIVREFIEFLATNKKWWLTPIILVLLLMGAIVVFTLANPAVAPFIYTLF